MRDLILIAHNLRSTHNVGSLLRTAEGFGVREVILSGYTPYPQHIHDARLPHLAAKIDRQIHKTALGAESLISWRHIDDLPAELSSLHHRGYYLAAIEQAADSQALPAIQPPAKVALVVGRETEGLETDILTICDAVWEIPMFGQKESFNVVQAAAMALYHCHFR